MLGRCGYFGKRDAVILPGDDVARVRDLHRRRVAVPLNLSAAMHLEQLGMQRPAVQLKNQLGDSRTTDNTKRSP